MTTGVARSLQPIPSNSPPGAVSHPVSLSVVEDADGYERSVSGVSIRSVRTGLGSGPNNVLAVSGGSFTLSAVSAGFPMLNRTTIGDDRFLAAVVRSTPPGASWCDIDLAPGMVVVFGPGAEHTGVNPAGIEFAFVAVETGVIGEFADGVGLPFAPPPRGRVDAMPQSPQATALGSTVSSLVDVAASGTSPEGRSDDDVLHRLTAALSGDRTLPQTRAGALHSRVITVTCTEYAEAISRIPSIRELCSVAHVSERRLRAAFVEVYGTPPSRFFRLWAMNEARRNLAFGDPASDSVTEIAFDLGIRHLSRFAGRYKALYGETPRTTLARRSAILP